MENSIYIYHHLGMGDSILCNGLVRHFAELYDKVYIFAKSEYIKNVLFMYRDNSKIKVIKLNDNEVKDFIKINNKNNYLIIGHTLEYVRDVEKLHKIAFDEGFYKMANIPLEYKWSKFYIKRDIEKEEEAFKIIGINKNEDYLFIHDDAKRGRNFKKEYIDNSLKSIRPAEHQNIDFFHFLSIIENAKEVHVHNSSFANIIDTMELNLKKVFYHRYTTEYINRDGTQHGVGDQIFSKKLNWIIYE